MAAKSNSSEVVSRSGRFAAGPAQDVAAFTESVSFDRRLWKQDIQGSIAHATMLQKAGLISRSELASIVKGLESIAADIVSERFPWREDLEDVHMNIESELTRRTPAGAKLHTARSRNDQVALDMRLWLLEEIGLMRAEVRDLQLALVQLAKTGERVLLPGYTHLQRAQPVSFPHHLLAYVEMLDRDHQRLGDCADRTNVCPLGSAAIAGTTLPVNRELVARLLGFLDKRGKPKLSTNSMDAVSDRDFVVEFCAHCSLIAVHLSRLAEDLVLWSSSEFNFVRMGDAYTTGSSLMPQKRNPDLAELTRGKSARVIGNLVALLTLLKGLPMTYNRDLQEDKERLFDTADTVRACLRVNAAMLRHTTLNTEACREAASDPALLATDLAEYLVQRGVPFREAHHAVGRAVAFAERKGVKLDKLSAQDLKQIHAAFGPDISGVFDLDKAMRKRTTVGSPGSTAVRRELKRWQRVIAEREA